MRNKGLATFLTLIVLMAFIVPSGVMGATQGQDSAGTDSLISFTILHTNDFHGQLEKSGSNPGLPSVAYQVTQQQIAVGGAQNTLLVDSGDEMQGSLLSNLYHGESTIGAFDGMSYAAATFGNHEFDWGQSVLNDRTTQANYPFVSANIVKNDTGDCTTAGWTVPTTFQVVPYVVKTLNTTSGTIKIGIIGVTTTETPIITVASATQGLCFKDPSDSILHYYDTVKSLADVVIVLSHLGYNDGGYGYGIPVYGDLTLANKLLTAGKYVPIIVGGHSHSNLTAPGIVTVGSLSTYVVQAYYNGRQLGRADLVYDTSSGLATVAWQKIAVPVPAANPPDPAGPTEDATIKSIIQGYANDPTYQGLINLPIGYSAVDLPRLGGTVDNMMGTFVDDAIYNYLNTDGDTNNDIDIFFNNAGGIRTDWCWNGSDWVNIGCVSGTHDAGLLTYGDMFTILPFGNATVVGSMTGAQILEVLNKGPQVSNGVIQPSGIKYSYYKYTDTNPGPQPYAWGAFDYCVVNKVTKVCEPLDLNRTYRVGTNEFLAPAGGDGYGGFKYMTNITYWGDMLNAVDAFVSANYGTALTAYAGPNGDGTLDNRILRDGSGSGGSIIPLTILHNNDSHGNLAKGSFVGMTQLATLIKQERLHNPSCTLLLDGGDQIQGDAMMYYFKSSFSGFAADGTPLDPSLWTQPMIAVMNSLGYDAMTLGNHEFNYGSTIFDGIFQQAQFPLLGANVSDTGAYGLGTVGPGGEGVQPYIEKNMCGGINVAVLGITNHRVPNYELPSNIVGLTFSNPIDTAQADVPALRANNDVVIALTHIGFTTIPGSVEVDSNVDTNLAATVPGIDAIIGAHSHTNPANPGAPYKQLPTYVSSPTNVPVIINQAYRYNNTLGEVILGLRALPGGGYEVVSRAGQYLTVTMATVEDPATKAIVDPYMAVLNTYNNTVVGQTTAPIDTLLAFTQETNGANLQADASVWELAQKGITDVDIHLSGAMTNKLMASGATPESPVTLKISDMFAGMPYENSLVVMSMNGPQIKAVLERGYRNYFYYKYVPGYGGYSYYTTCMLDTNSIGRIYYRDTYPALPDGNNVVNLTIDGQPVDFDDASTYYNVSTVNYLAAGSCNFNDNGVSLWPLNQIVHDTQYYVRDAVIDYIMAMGTISPAIEGRLVFSQAPELSTTQKTVTDANNDGLAQFGEVLTYTINIYNTGGYSATVDLRDAIPTGLTYVNGSLRLPAGFEGGVDSNVLEASADNFPAGGVATITFAAQVTQALPYGESFSNQVELEDQYASYSIPPAVIPMAKYYQLALTPLADTKSGDPGTVVAYTLQLTNTGNFTDVFTVEASSVWGTNLPVTEFTLPAGGTADVVVQVTVPPDAMAGDSDMATITATSSDGVTTASSELTTTASHVFGVSLDPAADALSGDPGTEVAYTLHLTNEGNATDVFTVEASSVWGTNLPVTEFTLPAGGEADVVVLVTVPSDAMAGDSDVATITATSSNGVTTASSELTTTANHIFGVSLDPAADALSGDPGTVVEYTLQLTNEGNATDVFSVEASSLWDTNLPVTEFTLPAGGTADVVVQVTVPPDALAGDNDVATITATSSNGETAASSELTTTANQIFAVSLDPATDALNGDPGTIVTYTLQLTNGGNSTDVFSVEASSVWDTNLPVNEFTLPAGGTAEVVVLVTVPSDAMAGDSDVATITATSSDGETAASSELTTTANAVYGFTLTPQVDAKRGHLGETVEYELHLVNTSNITETFTISYSGNMWDITLPYTSIELGAGAELDILVGVTIPRTAAHLAKDMVTISITSTQEKTLESVLTTTALRYLSILPIIRR